MKKIFSHLTLRLFIHAWCSIIMIASCDDDNQRMVPARIEFGANLQKVMEGDEATVLLTFDRPAPTGGSVELIVETNIIYRQHYTTDPPVKNGSIIFHISKGQKSAELKVRTIDNHKFEGTSFIILQLKTPTDGFRLGKTAATTLTLTIADDEDASVANFAMNSLALNEKDQDGIVVQIPLSAPARGEGSITVTLDAGSAVSAINFTIDQELVNNTFSLNVLPNADQISFKVFPVDNDIFMGNFILSFAITDVSGVVHKGNNTSHSLTLVDDETPSIAKFAFPSGTVDEANPNGIDVAIQLSSPVKGEGQLVFTLTSGNAVYGTHFTTLPALKDNSITLNLSHDQSSTSFTVLPINNDVFTDNLIQVFSISQVSGVVWKGSDDQSYELTIVEDEEQSIANFAITSSSIDEISSAGMEVTIQLSSPALGPGHIKLKVPRYRYNLTSDPQGEVTLEWFPDNSHYNTYNIVLDVARDDESVSFKILPLHNANSQCSEDAVTTFLIAGVSGSIRTGDNQTFDLTVKHDQQVIVTMSEKEGTVNENDAAGKEIKLNFLSPANTDGTLIMYADRYYLQRYTTLPKMYYLPTWGDIANLDFKKGDESVVFKVFPTDNESNEADFIEAFQLYGSRDACVINDHGAEYAGYSLTIVDED